ncbi:two-partner secretion domain-containing protein [Burkholderia stagnalis]|uniref:two-partner secretion domain-containing protein n=1 Tax=Burkholderia stagnalis TaxID=1503054 RepID=UPI000F5E99A3|nr:filamentous hemagglutinin N-terminal domain-containing protein [Burkholderia stagnalis]RQY63461.1 filamentous hemagglutinin N-terminal domain-containing protein [Burkholderia stagnalis]
MRIETTRTTLAVRLFQRDMARGSKCIGPIAAPASGIDAARPLWMRATALVMVAVTYFAPAVFLADEVAHAAPIVDPRAPIPFQPTVTQTSTGVPAINIPAANGNGISLGQYQSFDIDSRGLVLNNSTIAGSPLLGGTLGANPNLSGRPATTIINQVTSNNIAALNGPLEVFGAPATVIVAAPGGVSVNGMALTNVPGLTLATGTPQFLTSVGGSATDFAHAGAVAYDVRSGAITINGPSGVNGPGAGIEGTVGNIDLIGQSVSINAPLRADQRMNVVTGNQIVTPRLTDATGTTYGTSSNGATNTAAAIGRTVAVDASQYGSVTSGTVYIVSTAAGMGVNTQGSLSATAGNVVVNSNGDIAVGQTFANQNVILTGAGNTTLGGTGFANQNYTVNANGDVNAPGAVSAGQNITMTAGGNLNAASVAANGAASLTAGQSMTIGTLSAHEIALQTTNGDLTVGSALSAPGAIAATAGRDLKINGQVQGGNAVALAGGRNATVNGAVAGIGNTSIAATTGTTQINGNAISNAGLSVTAGQSAVVGGNASAQGPLTVTAASGDATLAGTAVTPGALTVQASGTTTLGGQTQAGTANVSGSNVAVNGALATAGDATLAATNGSLTGNGSISTTQGNVDLSASQNLAYSGGVQSGGAVGAKAGQDITLADVSAPGAITMTAGRDATETGSVGGGGAVSVQAGRNAAVNGAVSAVGDTSITAQTGTAAVGGNLLTNGALSVSAAQDAVLGGTAQAAGPIAIVAQNGSITGNGNLASSKGTVSLAAGQNIALAGALESGSTLNSTAGGGTSLGGTVSAPGAIDIRSGTDTMIGGNAISGSTLAVTSGGNTAVSGSAASLGDMSLSATNGTLSTSRSVTTLGRLTANGQQGANLGGDVYSGGNAQLSSGAGNVAIAGTLSSPGTIAVTAGQDASISGDVHSGQSTSLTAARDVNLNGGLEVDGSGNAIVAAGRNVTGSGAVNVANDTSLTAGNNIGITGAIQTGNNLSATAANNVSVGATTAVASSSLTATNGSATLAGDMLSGGATAITAGGDIHAQGSVVSLGDLSANAKTGSLTAAGPVSTAGVASLNAGQNLTLSGQTTVSKDATLTATNIAIQGLSAGGNLTATASGNLDTAAGQLNQPFSSTAPALSVGGNATLSGMNVTTANAVVGGTTQISGTQSLTTGGTAAYKGSATLAGGTVNNVGTQMAAGNLTVSGSNVSNVGTLSSLAATRMNAANLTNSGSIYGATSGLSVSGTTINSGSLLATNALSLTTTALNNRGGTIFAGDVNHQSAPTGDVVVTVNGGSGTFDNTSGQILAQHNLTLNLPNQAFDPSAATAGTINLGNALAINALQVSNSGIWAMPGNSVSLNTTQGLTNTGTISKSGDVTLSTTGTLTNSGTISAGNNVNLSGTVVNQTGGTISANQDVNLTGAVTNAGTVNAVRDVNLSGTSYDNSGATTKAGRDLNASLAGDLVNVGGTISAQNNVTINAANVNNSRAGGNATSTTTSTTDINTAGLGPELLASPMGTETLSVTYEIVGSGTVTTDSSTITARVGDLQPVSATSMSAPNLSGGTLYGVALPTVTRTTTTTQASGAAGVIAAGQDLSITTGTLNNHGSTISAGHDATLNVAALDNGGDAKVTTITDSIDAASYTAFLTQLKAAYTAGTLIVLPNVDFGTTANITPGKVSAPALQTSTITSYTSQDAGQVVAGNNLNLNGTGSSLTNAGNLYAAQDLTIHANNFANQGYHTSNVTSTVGCAAGVSDAQCAYHYITQAFPSGFSYDRPGQAFTNALPIVPLTLHGQAFSYGPNNDSIGILGDQVSTQSYSYTQVNNTVFAGRDLVIAAPTASNTYGNLLAGRDVVIGGAGTSRSNTDPTNPQTTLTQAASVSNSSGDIQAGRDIAMSTAALTNTLSAPQQVYRNYGTTVRYGCSGANRYYCDAFVDMQSGNASTITANRNLSISAGSVANTGSLITAGGQVSIAAVSTVTNQDQTLNAYWHDGFYGVIVGGSNPPDNFGCGTSTNCTTLFGSTYRSNAGIQPPTPYASLPGTIQAPSLTVTAGGALQNSGNVMGQQVSLTGATLVNGLTSPNVYTPQPTASQQVIPLGPVGVPTGAGAAQNGANAVASSAIQSSIVAAAVTRGTAMAIASQTVGVAVAPTLSQASVPGAGSSLGLSAGVASMPSTSPVQTISTQAKGPPPAYLINNPASQVIGGIGPSDLLANLPANLRPGSTLFYYDPFSENQVLQQAALAQTGTASFIDGLKFDSQEQKSVIDQEKSVLYANAIAYANAHNIALGTALSSQQISALDAPMLWYVEETVPEPGCTATGVASCPTVAALMPQVYLPQNYAVVQHDGTIVGQDVSLTATNKGTITNTGTIAASGTLSINAGTVANQQRSTDVGTIYTYLPDVMGLMTTTGTVAQRGGFMSAANYDLNVDRLNQVGGALQKLDPNGQVNAGATADQLAALKSQLGGNFTQSAVSDNLHTSFQSLADSPGLFEQIGMAVTAVVASFITAGAASAFMAAGGVMAGTVGGSMVSAGVGGFSASAISQASTGQFSFTAALQSGLTSAVTAGLTNGITYSPDAGVGWAGLGGQIGDNSLSALAGVKNVGGAIVPQAGASTAATIGQTALALGAEATIQAGVQTAIQGGSFLTNLRNSAVADLAAAVAYGIGDATNPYSVQNVLEHAVLGCAAGAATGQGCGGGAVGAATSAVISPLLVYAAASSGADATAQQALVGGLATAVGGAAAAAAGQNVQAGMTAAQNNALNNDLQHVDKVVQLIDKLRARNHTIATKYTSDDLLKAAENVYGGNGGSNGMRVWNSLADAQAGTAARGTTFYKDAQGQYVEYWKVPAGAEDVARGIVDNARFDNGSSYANVTKDNLGQLMSTYIAQFGADTSNFQGLGEGAAGLGLAGTLGKNKTSGSFSIVDWNGYPNGVPVPDGPFQLLEGADYAAARKAANAANSSIRQEQGLVGQPVDVHEVQPVKFGGSATDPENKVILPRDLHRQQVTPWWNKLLKDITK